MYPAGRECGAFRQCCGRKRVHARVFTLCNSTRIAVLNSASLQQHWNALLNDIGIALIQVVKPLRSRPACRVLFAFLAEKHAGRRSEHTRHDGRLRQQQRRSRIHPGVSPRYFGPQRLGSVQLPRGTGFTLPTRTSGPPAARGLGRSHRRHLRRHDLASGGATDPRGARCMNSSRTPQVGRRGRRRQLQLGRHMASDKCEPPHPSADCNCGAVRGGGQAHRPENRSRAQPCVGNPTRAKRLARLRAICSPPAMTRGRR